jgi:hypothetical protein
MSSTQEHTENARAEIIKEIVEENFSGQALVAHVCNPSQEAEIRRIIVQSQPWQIVHETPPPFFLSFFFFFFGTGV